MLGHAARGDRLVVAYLTSGELGLKHLPMEQARALREKEAEAAGQILRVARADFWRAADWSVSAETARLSRALDGLMKAEEPGMVYVPHSLEEHPDHEAAWPLLRQVLRQHRGPIPEVRAYEVWTPLSRFDHVEDITLVFPQKILALQAYASQLKEFDYERAVRGLNQYRGVLAARVEFAEVFQSLSPHGDPEQAATGWPGTPPAS